MLLSCPVGALLLAAFVSARPLPHHRRQNTIADFGSCNATPDVVFALGLDGRKDPSFQAKNNDVYNHGSALGIGVITSFICQQLNDRCKAPQTTLDACASGQAAAAKATGGAAADNFNAAFGIVTNFASGTTSTEDEGAKSTTEATGTLEATNTSPAASTATVTASASTSTPCPTDPITVTVTGTQAVATSVMTSATNEATMTTASFSTADEAGSTSASTPTPTSTGAASSLDLGSCTSNPTIEFGPAFEGRRAAEFSNKPVNKQEFNQASALNIDIVTRAICDILANQCKAPQATLEACAKGQAAASQAAVKTGAQADAFNAALGITTDFATVPAAPGGGPGSVALATTPNFGTCTGSPAMKFGTGFDGRTEASFQPANKADFNHGSALNPTIIATAICDTLVNTCNANKPAIDNCAAAKAAISGLSGQAVVDAFNAAVLKGAAQ